MVHYIFRSRFKIDASYPFISFYLTLVTHALSISSSLPNVTRSHLYSFRLHIFALLCVYLIRFFHVDRKFRAHENTQNLLNCQHTITVAITNLYIYLFSSIWFSHHFACIWLSCFVLFCKTIKFIRDENEPQSEDEKKKVFRMCVFLRLVTKTIMTMARTRRTMRDQIIEIENLLCVDASQK